MFRFFLGVIVAVGLLWCVSASDSGAQPRPAVQGKPMVPIGWPREVKGYGKTADEAKKNALQHAVERVAACLRIQEPPLTAWQPDEEYLRKHLLAGPGQQGDDVKLVDGVNAKVWVLTLRESPDFGTMVKLNQAARRSELASERQSMAGNVLFGLSALLALGWGYIRLDEWTKGRFSKWLQIGAVGSLVLTGLAWWLSV